MSINKYHLGFVVLIIMVGLLSFRPEAITTFWYVNGEEYHWYQQDDVFAYRNFGQEESTLVLDANYVAHTYFDTRSRHKLNFVYFKQDISESAREAIRQQIRGSQHFEAEFPAITLFKYLPYHEGKWFVTDDIIMVNFKDGVTDSEIGSFESRNNLWAFSKPSETLPQGNYTYLYLADISYGNPIEQSRQLYEDEIDIVKNVQPNLINAYNEEGNVATNFSSNIEDSHADSKERYYVVNVNNQSLQIFPELNDERQQVDFAIYDYFGRKLISLPVDAQTHNHEVNIAHLATGFYISTIEDGHGKVIASQKFRKL